MEIRWQKQGLIFVPSGEGFFKTHAARPIPWRKDDTTLRLFFSSRDDDDRMLPTYIDVTVENPGIIVNIHDRPLIGLGSLGTFDDSGTTLACLLEHDDKRYFYYTGWKRRRVVSFEMAIGIFEWPRENADSLERLYEGPILAQDRYHPLLTAGPFVIFDEDRFKMWYCSGTEWRAVGDVTEPIYTVFYAESADGISWQPLKQPVIEYSYDGEVISAPWVIKNKEQYHMWYSTRGYASHEAKRYRIGYAESPDGIMWTRLDHEVGISVSDSGWDSEMICYPSFYPHSDKIYMFYSGNNVGKGGVGYAVADNFLV